jgi:c-di-GMP-binding flagellar brake protein YcgR
VLAVVFLAVLHSGKGKGGNWVQFYAKGKEAGFSFKEIEILRQLAMQCHLEFPNSLFESLTQLDKCIRFLVRSAKTSGESGNQAFLSRLYDYRQKVELNKSPAANGITDSRQISESQVLRVLVEGRGVFKSQVIKNSSQFLTIARPVNSKNASPVSWAKLKISIYFWREDDAGYVFDTEVLDEVFSLGVPSVKITHADSLFRTQKRKSIRVKMQKAAFLYLVSSDEAPHKTAANPGLKCLLEDISDTGCAVTVGGRADAGLRVKVQFALNNVALCMSGTVRSIRYNEITDRSILHIEAEPLPVEIRNRVLGEVFGMQPPEENEDELPFSILDDDMEEFAADDGVAAVAPADGAPADSVSAGESVGDVSFGGAAAVPEGVSSGGESVPESVLPGMDDT